MRYTGEDAGMEYVSRKKAVVSTDNCFYFQAQAEKNKTHPKMGAFLIINRGYFYNTKTSLYNLNLLFESLGNVLIIVHKFVEEEP
jgi:hypothetical protein